MNALKEGWFSELDTQLWPGHCLSLENNKMLYQGKSKYQDVLVFNNKAFGNVLVLDGRIQATEKDEHSYQEMIAFLPLNAHPNPERVLIIGGGDGGVAREVCKHPAVKHVTQCEIDEDVIKVSKQFLPNMAKGFDNPKMNLHIGDGFKFLAEHKNEFDVIITDSSDPEGPAASLFQVSYYELMRDALRAQGIVCCQGENFWLFSDLIKQIVEFAGNIFPSVGYAQTQIPTYPTGCIGFILCSKEEDKQFSRPVHVFDDAQVDELELKYYNKDIHHASFVLPTESRKVLAGLKNFKAPN
jgi:spermidine synthase